MADSSCGATSTSAAIPRPSGGEHSSDLDAGVISEGTAVVVGTVNDTVVEDQEDARYRMPITMVWIRGEHWRLLVARAGPRTAAAATVAGQPIDGAQVTHPFTAWLS